MRDPWLSIIVPVRDEAEAIVPALGRLTCWKGVEVVVAVDAATRDGSATAAAGVRGVSVVTAAESGRGPTLATGAAAAHGRHLLFLHADSFVSERAVRGALACMGGRSVAATFSIRLDSPRPVFRWLEAGINLRTRLFGLPYGDQGLLISRAAYDGIGGFRPLPRCEDLDFVLRLRRAGRIAVVADRCTTSTRRWDREGVIRVTVKNVSALGRFLLRRAFSGGGALGDEHANDSTRSDGGDGDAALDRPPIRG